MTGLPLTTQEFDEIYSKVTRLTVEVIVVTDEGIVLTKRSIQPCIGQWHIPGGTVRFGEFVADAVLRIAQEELGVGVRIVKSLGYIEYPDMLKNGYKGWPVGMAFEVVIVSGELRGSHQGEEVRCFAKIPENTILEQKMFLKDHLASLLN